MLNNASFRLKVLGSQQWDSEDDNVDVEVKFEDGSRFTATFFTLRNLHSLFEKNKRTGECQKGTYLWATEMIVVEQLDERTMEMTVRGLLEDGEFSSAFTRVPNIAHTVKRVSEIAATDDVIEGER
ncbi:MAG: hypothetical protein MI861_15950 [Pirellulales bacterium]|nr:hypothetical protein [Pirellulales bacterium]